MSYKPVFIDNSNDGSAGRSPHIGENGNWFVWDGEQWVDTNVEAVGGASGGELPWCEGVFGLISIATSIYTTLTPTVQVGNDSMIVNNSFIAPTKGVYALTIDSIITSAATRKWSFIVKGEYITSVASPSIILTRGLAVSEMASPALTWVAHMNAGDKLSTVVWSGATVAMTEGCRFCFSQLTKEGAK